MRIARPVAVVAVAATLLGAGTAGAAVKKRPAPKPVCNLLTDPAGDANGFVVTDTPLPSDDKLDVISGDIATDAKNLTAAIRLKSVGPDSTAPTGSTLYFNFAVGDTKMFVDALFDGQGGTTFKYGDFTGTNGGRKSLGTGTGVVDTAKNEVRITAPLSGFSTPIKPGTKISGLEALAQRFIGTSTTGGATPTADDSTSDKVYKAGTLSCVKPGK